jgi:hypothetical protein
MRNVNHFVDELFRNVVVPILIRFRKITPGDVAFSKTTILRFSSMSTQNRDEFSKAIASGKLAKHHNQQLVPAAKRFYVVIPLIFQNNSLKNSLAKTQ